MVRLSSHPLKRKVLVVITDQLIISLLRAKTHKDAETTLKALGGGQAFTASQGMGIDSKDLPFIPEFA